MATLTTHQEIARTLGNVHSIEGLKRLLNEASEEFELHKFAIASEPLKASRSLSEHILCSNLSPDLLTEYDELNMLSCSTHFKALRGQPEPRIWQSDMEDEYIAAEPAENMKRTRDFLYKNRIVSGCSFPVSTAKGDRGIVMFMGSGEELDETAISYLDLISKFAFGFMANLSKRIDESRNILTKRECEIITWAADGKTSGEIATILSVSDHTINTHLHSAMRKMDCVNRTQLVATALRLNIIK